MRSLARGYENALLAILTLSLGFTIFDRVAINLLSPFILADLGLRNTGLGLVNSALSVGLAGSGYLFGTVSDRAQSRKLILCGAVFVFSALSASSGLAVSLLTMMAARLLMGVTEGPILPLSYSILAVESSPHRRAFNMGFLANFATCLIAGVIGPIVITHIAAAMGWRAAFFLAGIPGLLVGWLILRYVREPAQGVAAPPAAAGRGTGRAVGRRNVWLCIILCCGIYTWLLVTLTFLPIYLVRVAGLTPTQMGWFSAINGLSGCTLAIGVSWLADRIGRKPTMILFCLAGLLVPLAGLLAHGSIPLMAAMMFLGWSAIGCSPLFAGTIPAETVPAAETARTLAMIIGIGEVFAGVIMPTAAGRAADLWGLDAPWWIVLAATAISAAAACFLEETRPAPLPLTGGALTTEDAR